MEISFCKVDSPQLSCKIVNLIEEILVDCFQRRKGSRFQLVKHPVFKKFQCLSLTNSLFFPGKIVGTCQPNLFLSAMAHLRYFLLSFQRSYLGTLIFILLFHFGLFYSNLRLYLCHHHRKKIHRP